MDTPAENAPRQPIGIALCIGEEAFARLQSVWRHLCVGLLDHSVTVRLVTDSEPVTSLAFGPVEVIRHDPIHWPLRHHRIHHLIDRLAEEPPDVIHAASADSYGLAAELAAALDVDWVAHVTSVRDAHAARLMTQGGKVHFVVGSPSLENQLGQALGRPGSTCTLIQPGILCDKQATCFQDADRIPTLMCTAPLEAERGVEELIEALALLECRGREVMAFFMGRGSREALIRRRVAARGLRSKVTFARPVGDWRELMHEADVYVVPGPELSLNESTILALGAGMAVVAVEGGVGECFLHEETALVCGSRSPQALSEAIERLIADHDLAKRLAEGALSHMKRQHSLSAMVEQTHEVYQRAALHRRTYPLPSAEG